MAAVYEAGPGQPYATVGSIPWTSLQPGDVVRIHAKPGREPYYEKITHYRPGTAALPITIQGVPDALGNLPILDGQNAIQGGYTGGGANAERGLFTIGNNSPGAGNYTVLENLELRNAYQDYTFTRGGTTYSYASNAAGLYIQNGAGVVVRNCWIHHNGNGVFANNPSTGTTNLLLEYCFVENNGVVGSSQQHNFYMGTAPLTVQFCRIGGLRPGADGQNFKDRGSGTIFRYNWVEGGPNDQLDLVEDGAKPAHFYAYGNVLIKTNLSGNGRLVMFGGDSGGSRSGTLYFVNNTVITTRSNTTVFQVPSADCRVEAHNNIIWYNGSGARPTIRSGSGVVSGTNNWISPGFATGGAALTGTIPASGNDPGFVAAASQDYGLHGASDCRDAGAIAWPGQALTTALFEYVKHQDGEPRPVDGHIDIGAYEYPANQPGPRVTAVSPPLDEVAQTSAPFDRITVTFDSDVQISRAYVTLTGVNTGVVDTFLLSYNAATKTATLSLLVPLTDDTYVVTISDEVRAGTLPLDGEVDDPAAPTWPSGDGVAGGDLTFYLYRLVGDVDSDREVSVLDVVETVTAFGQTPAGEGWNERCDFDEDGEISVLDVVTVVTQFGRTIPEGP